MEKIGLAAKCCINTLEQGPAEGLSLAERAKIKSLNKKKKNIIEPSLAGFYMTSINHLQVKEKSMNPRLSFIDKTQANEIKKTKQDITVNKGAASKDVKLIDFQYKNHDIKNSHEIMRSKKVTDNKVLEINEKKIVNVKTVISEKIINDGKVSNELSPETTSELPLQSVVNVIDDAGNIKPRFSYDSSSRIFSEEKNVGSEKYLNTLNLYEQKLLNSSLSGSLNNLLGDSSSKLLNSSLSSNNSKHVTLKNTENAKVNDSISVKNESIIYKFQNTPGDNSVKITNLNTGTLSLTTSSDFVHHLLQNEKAGKVVANDFELLSDSWKDEDETGESKK